MKVVASLFFISFLVVCYAQDDIKECPQKEQFTDPCGTCAPKCINGEFVKRSCGRCREACVCPNGFIMNENEECIPIEKCKGVPNCPDKKEYLPCGPPCTPLCREGNLLLPRCVPCCTPGCFCKEGYILNDNGDCVKECVPPRK